MTNLFPEELHTTTPSKRAGVASAGDQQARANRTGPPSLGQACFPSPPPQWQRPPHDYRDDCVWPAGCGRGLFDGGSREEAARSAPMAPDRPVPGPAWAGRSDAKFAPNYPSARQLSRRYPQVQGSRSDGASAAPHTHGALLEAATRLRMFGGIKCSPAAQFRQFRLVQRGRVLERCGLISILEPEVVHGSVMPQPVKYIAMNFISGANRIRVSRT